MKAGKRLTISNYQLVHSAPREIQLSMDQFTNIRKRRFVKHDKKTQQEREFEYKLNKEEKDDLESHINNIHCLSETKAN